MLDLVGSAIGLFGTTEVTFGLALGLAVARAWRRQRDAIVPLFIALTVVAEAVLKLAVAHPPPPDDRVRTVDLIPTLHVAFANSFPSGHVMRITFLATIARGLPLWIGTAAVVLMVVSRVYLAEHWLSDCVGGLAIGIVVAGLAYALIGRAREAPAWTGRPGAATRR